MDPEASPPGPADITAADIVTNAHPGFVLRGDLRDSY